MRSNAQQLIQVVAPAVLAPTARHRLYCWQLTAFPFVRTGVHCLAAHLHAARLARRLHAVVISIYLLLIV